MSSVVLLGLADCLSISKDQPDVRSWRHCYKELREMLANIDSFDKTNLFLCYISEHWITARTLNMTINHKIPQTR